MAVHKIETKPIFLCVHSHPIAGWRETLLEKSLLQVKWEEFWLLLRYLTRQKGTRSGLQEFKPSRNSSQSGLQRIQEFSPTGNFQSICYSFKTLSYSFKMYPTQQHHFNCKPSRHCLIPATPWAKLPREIRILHSPGVSFLCTPMRNWFICFLAGLYLMEERD